MDDQSTRTLNDLMTDMAAKAKLGAEALRLAGPDVRTRAIIEAAKAIRAREASILAANEKDQQFARDKGLTEAMIERLILNPARVEAMAKGLEEVAALPDPVGRDLARWTRPNGLDIARVSTPIGVIAIIYESRPNVTADAAALCVRSSNAAILRTGSEALNSALAIYAAFEDGFRAAGLPDTCVQLVPTSDRDAVGLILGGLDGTINLIIPRGGRSLVERVQKEARAPVLAHLEGLNHTYVHTAADPEKAVAVTLNAKMRRVSVCGATETLLIDEAVAETLLPRIAKALEAKGCELRGDDRARAIHAMAAATEEDWKTEYLLPIISIRVVRDESEAISHIKTYGSGHTEAIITEDAQAAETFLNEVDSAIVIWNASTQYADGGEFGLGAEIGISTDRLHARGPVGAEQLTTFKYVVRGNGQTRP
ncbi:MULTISPECIES: glutamate-5-semialdehyde dehydrogenase [Asticcacaulis]|uniref:glutamate-5-semialdehyde dehydrogenase n=1 Tax=Asticcacaulis TaxID=76890 RepID=UPI001AE88DBD|nr:MULTISPECIES: glutamate-5-semialdehyde dehydrogenase [Asticcacaulis]MBP2160201.1 glutamate-5-semialdehyde dehydrogenase [Asticcacaulis solisilvae]MDR6801246.1 glutamate-5-semialdehyde dehydrogenase [Asticcacaulis sp. BE141]